MRLKLDYALCNQLCYFLHDRIITYSRVPSYLYNLKQAHSILLAQYNPPIYLKYNLKQIFVKSNGENE